jgi:sugar phosphate isomerase/epimerase
MQTLHALSRRSLLRGSVAAAALPLISSTGSPSSQAFGAEADPFKGLKIGVATYTFRKFPLEATIKGIQRVGLHYASIKDFHMARNTTAQERKDIAQKFKDAGITPLSCGNITMENTEKSVRDAFEYARDAGIPTIVCSPDPDSFAILDKMVKEFDIRLAIHNHGPEDKRFPSPYDVYKAVLPYDKRIGLCVDLGHAARAGAEPAEAILKCRDRLHDVHLKDIADLGRISHPVESGRGVLNLKAVMGALLEIKFPYMADFEYEKDADDPLAGLAESVGYTKALMACAGR